MSDNNLNEYPYQPTIKIEDFEGPLDLLLHLIRENKMDIYDIKIATITSQYIDYLRQQQAHQLEIAGDYFVMAATLMNIKSQMLLPQQEDLDEEEEIEDPREELVEQLLEYQRYKRAADQLKDKEEFRRQEFTRPAMHVPRNMIQAHVEPGVTVDQLQAAFVQVLKNHRLNQPVVETVEAETVSVAQRMDEVVTAVKTGPIRFDEIFQKDRNRDQLVTTFLAVLELSKHHRIEMQQAEMFGPIILVEGTKIDGDDEPSTD
ncbi:MAG: segregation/condensation protein A [Limosilactobacillus sp.]|uniref:segregation and condensation protein A n=1 Tax=Limosilactobacillus sp. TaxID=2773925 RepID=UPI0026F7483F|nr:segregation/condensation protein A [Limosilactobacillus sp.]